MSNEVYTTDAVIIGAGPVGLFSVFQAGMLGMRTAVIDSLESIGGQCTALYPEKPIFDIPSQPKISAQNLIDQLKLQGSPFKPLYFLDQHVQSVVKKDKIFSITTSQNVNLEAKIVIIAAGPGCFGPNKPPLAGIEKFEGKSVFYMVRKRDDFKDKKIVIAGGGDSAIDWTISLAEVAKRIFLVHRRDKFRASPENVTQINKLAAQGKIELVIGYQLNSLLGNDGQLTSVIVSDLDNNTKTLDADILLPFFGLTQQLGPIAKWGLNLKSNHICANPPYYETNIPGIYAIGDIATYEGKLKLILTGFAESASALHHAYSRVFDGKALHFEYSTTKGVHGG